MAHYKGHHRRDEAGNVLSRAEETRLYRQRHPGRRTAWDAVYRQSDAGETSHKKYNVSEKGRTRAANLHLQKMYGKTLNDKEKQRESQRGVCTMCDAPLPADLSKCAWDHNHNTGKMRDVLHPLCNLAVGVVEGGLLNLALTYVQRHSNV